LQLAVIGALVLQIFGRIPPGNFLQKNRWKQKPRFWKPRLVVGCPENAQLLRLVQMAQAAKQGLRLPATKSLAKQQDATWSLTHSG